MLCNQIAEYCATPRFAESQTMPEQQAAHRHVRDLVAGAPRFVLDRSATLLVHGLQNMTPSKFLEAFRVCRLPFPRMWVEFEFAHRLEWQEDITKRTNLPIREHPGSVPPIRLGFYLEQGDEDGRLFSGQPVWSQRSPVDGQFDVSIGFKSLLMSTEDRPPVAVSEQQIAEYIERTRLDQFAWDQGWGQDRREISAYYDLTSRISHFVPNYLLEFWAVMGRDPKVRHFLEEAATYDLAAEWRFIAALLTVLNSRNVLDFGPMEEHPKLNKARLKKGKPPLLSHRPVTLSLHLRRNMQRGQPASSNEARNIQRHLVAGHFKLRKGGLFWWSMHARGGAGEVPSVPRTYRVTA